MSQHQLRKSVRRFHTGIGEIAGPGGWNATYCCILDLSDTGAKVEVSDGYKFARPFEFKKTATGETRTARLAWQKGRFAGIEFTQSAC